MTVHLINPFGGRKLTRRRVPVMVVVQALVVVVVVLQQTCKFKGTMCKSVVTTPPVIGKRWYY